MKLISIRILKPHYNKKNAVFDETFYNLLWIVFSFINIKMNKHKYMMFNTEPSNTYSSNERVKTQLVAYYKLKEISKK